MINKICSTLVFVLFLIIAMRCSNTRTELKQLKKGEIFETKLYANGNIKSEGIYAPIGIKNGWYKEYYENGKLKFEGQYVNDLKEGWFIYYTEDGILESKGFFLNGLSNGLNLEYYDNGKIKVESYWVNDKQLGEAKYYFENGRMDTYDLIDFEGHNRYLKKFDEQGNVIKEEGSVIGQLGFSTEFDSVKVGEEIRVRIIAAQPPSYETKVFIGKLNNKGESSSLLELPLKNNIATYKTVFKERGESRWITIGQMKDSNNNIFKQDTTYLDIKVR